MMPNFTENIMGTISWIHLVPNSCLYYTGTFQQVNKALDMIKRKFPVKRFPGIDYDRCLPDVPVLPADIMQVIHSHFGYSIPVQ